MSVAVDLRGRTALVTGGSRGIGRASALLLAEAGADVVVHYRTRDAEAERTAEDIRGLGRRATVFPYDLEAAVAEPHGFWEAASAALSTLGDDDSARSGSGFDIVVGNAGIDVRKNLADYTASEISTLFAVNILAPLALARTGSALLHDGAAVAFVSSVAGEKPFLPSIPYGLTKAALDNLVRALAREGAERRIRVNAVAPGAVDTELQHDRDRIARLKEQHLAADPAQIAKVILFLSSPLSEWVNGQIVTATGDLFP